MMVKIANDAQYFENHAPWAEQYKKLGVKPPLAKAVETVIETGDFAVTIVGDNLPVEMLESAQSIIAMDPPRHSKLRRLVSAAFTPKQMRRIEDRINANATSARAPR